MVHCVYFRHYAAYVSQHFPVTVHRNARTLKNIRLCPPARIQNIGYGPLHNILPYPDPKTPGHPLQSHGFDALCLCSRASEFVTLTF